MRGEMSDSHAKKVAAFCGESRHNAQPRTQPGKANFGYVRCNCPGLVCVIEGVDRKSAPVKFGSRLGPIRGSTVHRNSHRRADSASVSALTVNAKNAKHARERTFVPRLCTYSEREMREERERHRFGPSLCTYSEREKREERDKREKPCQWAMAVGRETEIHGESNQKKRKFRVNGPWRKVRNRSGLEEKSRFGTHVPPPPK